MNKIPEEIRQDCISMRKQGYSYPTIADTLGISERSIKRICTNIKGELDEVMMNKKGYGDLQKCVTLGGTEYYAGYTNRNHYVELAPDGGAYFTEAGVWQEGKDIKNCKSALKRTGKSE